MSDKTPIQKHTEWIAEKVAEARELGLRDGAESLSVAHVIANLYCDLEDMREERDLAEAQLKEEEDRFESLVTMLRGAMSYCDESNKSLMHTDSVKKFIKMCGDDR